MEQHLSRLPQPKATQQMCPLHWQGPNRAEIEWDRAMAAEHPVGTPLPQLTGAASATSAALTGAKATPASITGGAATAAGTTPASIGGGKVIVTLMAGSRIKVDIWCEAVV